MTWAQKYHEPRGPLRTIEAIEERTAVTLLLLSCEHIETAPHHHYQVGDDSRCFQCGQQETNDNA
jgi:hypothetical protein